MTQFFGSTRFSYRLLPDMAALTYWGQVTCKGNPGVITFAVNAALIPTVAVGLTSALRMWCSQAYSE